MQFKKVLTVGFGLLTQLTSAYADVAPPAGSSEDTNTASVAHCDVNCAHRLIFRTGYASAAAGFRMVLGSCNAFDWCVQQDWCPDTINITLTKIAAQSKTDTTAELNYNNFNNLTLLSAMSTVSARSTRTAISLAQSMLEFGNYTCDKDRIAELEKVRWLMSQQEGPIDYDADKFEEVLASPDDEPLETGLVKRDGNDDDDGGTNPWAIAASGLGIFPIVGLSAAACDKWEDFVLCKQFSRLARLLSKGKNLLSKNSMLRSVIEQAENPTLTEPTVPINQMLQDVPPEVPAVPQDVLPPPSEPDFFNAPEFPAFRGDPDPAVEFLRTEMFDPLTGQATQWTIEGSYAAAQTGTLKWFNLRDSLGRYVKTIVSDPGVMAPMRGQWASLPSSGSTPSGGSASSGSSLSVRQQVGSAGSAGSAGAAAAAPVLNCLGEPIVAAGAGTLMTMAPIAALEGSSMIDDAFSRAKGIGGMLYDMFLPEGGQPSQHTIVYNAESENVEIAHDISAHQNEPSNDDHEQHEDDDHESHEDSDQSLETDSPPTTIAEATTTGHDHAPPSPTATQTQVPDHGKPSNSPDTHQPTPTSISKAPKPTTLRTMTTMWKTKTETETMKETTEKPQTSAAPASGGFSGVTHVSGCKTLEDCPCDRYSTCQIGDLPSECNIGAVDIEGLPYEGDTTWDECVDKINNLDRKEAKAWAAAITLPYCLSGDEWEPKDNSKEEDECYMTVDGEEFAKVRDVYINGMLPLECPTRSEIGENRGWHGISEELEAKCKRAGEILARPF